MRRILFTVCLGLLLCVPSTRQASAITIVRILPESEAISLGESVDVLIVAQTSESLLGWGLDLSHDARIEILGPPLIGPLWIAVPSSDGDALAGVAFPSGITGSAVLLATITIRGIAPGVSLLQLGTTALDLTEGFALDAAGFETRLSFVSAEITVPEPPLALLLISAFGMAAALRRHRSIATRLLLYP